jgi:hypothetical protein
VGGEGKIMGKKAGDIVKNLAKGELLYEGKAKKVFAANYPDLGNVKEAYVEIFNRISK